MSRATEGRRSMRNSLVAENTPSGVLVVPSDMALKLLQVRKILFLSLYIVGIIPKYYIVISRDCIYFTEYLAGSWV